MKYLISYCFMSLLFVVFSVVNVCAVVRPAASVAPAKIFSQEVLSFQENGEPYPAMDIIPEKIKGMRSFSSSLPGGHLLSIQTNAQSPEKRGLHKIVNTIESCYRFIEQYSGRSLDADILIYLIEVDFMPRYYRFKATYTSEEADWEEVRFAFVKKGKPLYDVTVESGLNDLLFDTLPHELGHDLLKNISNLRHDIDNQPSFRTRWFIEGVCELFAKEFSRKNAPHQWKRFLGRRNIHKVFGDNTIRNSLFDWSQHNVNSFRLESDLYGASFLVLKEWCKRIPVKEIISLVSQGPEAMAGAQIRYLLETTTGVKKEQIVEFASRMGMDDLQQLDMKAGT